MKDEIGTIIMFHHDLPRANVAYNGDLKKLPDSVHTLIATDSSSRHQFVTHLNRTKKGFEGTPKLKSFHLKGIGDKLVVPSILIPPEDNRVVLTLDLGGVSFTQIFTRHPADQHCESVFFGGRLLADLSHRIHITYMRNLNRQADVAALVMYPGVLKKIMQQGEIKFNNSQRETKIELVKETTNKHIVRVQDSGLILKRTTTIYNKDRKVYIDYIVVSATGSMRLFEGENTTFEREAKTGYVLLTDLPKVTK